MGFFSFLDLNRQDDFQLWQRFIYARQDAHCSDLAQWRLLFNTLYGITAYNFIYREGGRVRGAASLYRIRSPFLGHMLVSSPFFGQGGLYAEDDRVRSRLLGQADRLGKRLGVDYIEWRLPFRLEPPYSANTDFSEFDLDLNGSTGRTWRDKLSSNARQNVRKSRRHGVQFGIAPGYRDSFQLLCRSMRFHGTPFHGERFFRLLKQFFGTAAYFPQVRLKGRPAAAGVVVRFKENIITPYIGSLPETRRLGTNYAQYWGIITHAIANGVSCFELGRSPVGSTHARFKVKWGARSRPIYYNFRILRPGRQYRSVSRPARLFNLATRVWRQLPLVVTRALGPWLFRYIP